MFDIANKQQLAIRPEVQPILFINRDLNYLALQHMLLINSSSDKESLEKSIKKLVASAQNIDEFYKTRVSALDIQIAANVTTNDSSESHPFDLMQQILQHSQEIIETQDCYYFTNILPKISAVYGEIINNKELTEQELNSLKTYFQEELRSLLTPFVANSDYSLPYLTNGLYVCARGKTSAEEYLLCIVQVPPIVPHIFPLSENRYILLSEVLQIFMSDLFPTIEILELTTLKLIRSVDFRVEQRELADLLTAIKRIPKAYRGSNIVTCSVPTTTSAAFLTLLATKLKLASKNIFKQQRPIMDNWLLEVADCLTSKDEGGFEKAQYELAEILQKIWQEDILLELPTQLTLTPQLLLAHIQKTREIQALQVVVHHHELNIELVNDLITTTKLGKQITIYLALKNYNRINYDYLLNKLEQNAIQVIFSENTNIFVANVWLLTTKCSEKMQTQLLLLTNDFTIEQQSNIIYGTSELLLINHFLTHTRTITTHLPMEVAKNSGLIFNNVELESRMIAEIEALINLAHRGARPKIILKMQELTNPKLIKFLYRASQAGVEVEIYLTTSCILRPQVPTLSENIKVYASQEEVPNGQRIFAFYGQEKKLYLSSADWQILLETHTDFLLQIATTELAQSCITHLAKLSEQKSEMLELLSDGSYTKFSAKIIDNG